MENKFFILNEEGLEIECEILFTFDNEETGKSYIVYTDYSKEEEGNIQVYASIYNPKLKNPQLEAIETQEEWQVIEDILYTLQESAKMESY